MPTPPEDGSPTEVGGPEGRRSATVVNQAEVGLVLPTAVRARQILRLLPLWIRRDLRVRYRQSVLKTSWSVVQPMVVLVTYGWVFTSVLDVAPVDVPYLTFAWTGIVGFTFFSQSVGVGVSSLQGAGSLISRLAFPREVLPLAVVGSAAVDLGVMLVLLLAVSWVQVGPPSVELLGLVLPVALLAAWSVAVTVASSAITVFRRDLNHALPLALRIAFIVSPVMYPASLIEDLAPVAVWGNPLAVAMEAMRGAVYGRAWPDLPLMAVHLAVALLAVAAAFALFRRLDPRMSDHV